MNARVGLAPLAASTRRRGREAVAGSEAVVFWIILTAIVSQLTVSTNLLQWIGIPYDAPGGLPLEKFHPGTYLATLAVALQAWRQRPVMANFVECIASAPHFAAGTALMLLCSFYTLFSTGMSGSAVYIESYAAAGLLGMAMEQLTAARLRIIAYVMLAVFVGNALLCIVETMRQQLLVPVWLTNPDGVVREFPAPGSDFRGVALYANPLSGAIMSMMGVLLCLACDLRPATRIAALGILVVSLISFGGRTAMAVTYLLMAGLTGLTFLRRLIERRLSAVDMMVAVVALAVVPTLLAVLLFATPLGERISGRFYLDDSATVRVVQWHILGWMDLRDWLFGMGPERLNVGMLQIGLDPPLNDIENFWLLVFISLGLVGFAIWLGGLAIMLRRLWTSTGPLARIMLVSVLLVASGSNSLGRKSNILFVCVACIISQASFAHPLTAHAPNARPGAARPLTARLGAARPRFKTVPEVS